MKSNNLLMMNFIFTVTITFYTIFTARGGPIDSTLQSNLDEGVTTRHESNLSDYSSVESVTQRSNCNPVEYELRDVTILENNELLLNAKNITIPSSEYQNKNGKIFVCLSFDEGIDKLSVLNCSGHFSYRENEFRILPNNSAMIGRYIYPEDEYVLKDGILKICAPEYDYEKYDETTDHPDDPSNQLTPSIYVTIIGSVISIIALVIHLMTFVFLPVLRNVPGYNLASLSVSFLLAYFFLLIAQIPQIVGLPCIIVAVFHHNFFLTAFFCTNVLAFDVWRSLKLATVKLVKGSQSSRKRQFIWYSLYAWGVPLAVTTISIIVDNADNVPFKIKPGFGKGGACFITSSIARAVFFVAPVFILLLVNVVFFIRSSWMIFSNTMKVTKDQRKQTVKLNYILYLKLALMMGVTWLLGIIVILAQNEVINFIFDFLNSLQGLLLFLFFTCTRRVIKQLSEKSGIIALTTMKNTTLTSNATSVSAKTESNVVKS